MACIELYNSLIPGIILSESTLNKNSILWKLNKQTRIQYFQNGNLVFEFDSGFIHQYSFARGIYCFGCVHVHYEAHQVQLDENISVKYFDLQALSKD